MILQRLKLYKKKWGDVIYNEIQQYIKKDIYPFHMPGHKRNKDFFPENLWEFDITEIGSEVDIKPMQEKAARVFGADRSFYLMNGSSSGILSAVMSVCSDNDRILAARNSHISFYNALIFSGAIPIYINPTICENGLVGGVSPEAVEAALKDNPEIKAVFITSPTYEGFVSDVEIIAKIVHDYKKILIVDEAHGAHFVFSQGFPTSAVALDADIVIQSLHKTLPAMNPSAVLHVNGSRVDFQRLEQCISATQTTSPSYVVLGMAERCIELLSSAKGKELIKAYEEHLYELREDLSVATGIQLLGNEMKMQANIFDIDAGKLVFYIKNSFISGKKLQNILKRKYRIEIETSGLNHIIAMTSVADTNEGFHRLKEAILYEEKNIPTNKTLLPIKQYAYNLPPMLVPPRKAQAMKHVSIKLENSEGMIAGAFITPYPPGIPLVTPGEKITNELINNTLYYKNIGTCVYGVDNGNIIVLE